MASSIGHNPVTQNLGKPSVIVLFGAPGAGKGTFSQFIKSQYNYSHLSVGDLVRDEIDQQTDLGKEADVYLKKGEFLKESTIQNLVLKHVCPLMSSKKSFVLDGFPRTEEAVQFITELFAKHISNNKVLLVKLNATDNTCVERILSRAICKKCSQVYNTVFRKPKKDQVCDLCESPLKLRPNDTKEIINKRMVEYHEITEKAFQVAKKYFNSTEFDTEKSVEACFHSYTVFFNEASS